MGKFSRKKGPKKVQQYNFIESTQSLLDAAEDPDTKIKAAVSNAKAVKRQLGDVATGKLVVEPPLSHDQMSGLQTRAATIESIGQRALDALADNTEQRRGVEASASSASGGSFSGTGSDSKS